METDTRETSETASNAVKFLAGGLAEHLFESGALTQGLIDAFGPVLAKFATAQQLDFAINGGSHPDGPLGRHLNAFIESAENLLDDGTS